MPRKARIDAPGALHHIICRGIKRRLLFRDDYDRQDFVRHLVVILTETLRHATRVFLCPNGDPFPSTPLFLITGIKQSASLTSPAGLLSHRLTRLIICG